MKENKEVNKYYCICINSVVEGVIPIVTDEYGKPVLFQSIRDAELEIADGMITRLQEFIDGGRDFADAVSFDEFVVEVSSADDLEVGQVRDFIGN